MTEAPIIVLFGAGASFGAGETSPKPPPLGKDLFWVLRRLYPITWGRVPGELANLFQSSFEHGMDTVIRNHGFAVAPLMQDVAKFFSVFSAGVENLYFRLLIEAKNGGQVKKLLFSTLNYECVLESAVSRAGLSVSYYGGLPNQSTNLAVWKLHGSCNFKLKGIEATRGIQFGPGVSFGGGIEPLQPAEVQTYYSGNTALYPAMALYAKGKPVSIAPSVIKNAQENWRSLVLQASRVYVVGVNPNPEDTHIWTPLSESDADLLYIGGTEEFERWRKRFRPEKPSRILGARWDQTFDAMAADLSRP